MEHAPAGQQEREKAAYPCKSLIMQGTEASGHNAPPLGLGSRLGCSGFWIKIAFLAKRGVQGIPYWRNVAQRKWPGFPANWLFGDALSVPWFCQNGGNGANSPRQNTSVFKYLD